MASVSLWQEMANFICHQNSLKMLGGFKNGRSAKILREFSSGHRRLILDYFLEPTKVKEEGSGQFRPFYPSSYFEWRFRMSRKLFEKVREGGTREEPYFSFGDATVLYRSASPLQKVFCALRMILYGPSAESLDK